MISVSPSQSPKSASVIILKRAETERQTNVLIFNIYETFG